MHFSTRNMSIRFNFYSNNKVETSVFIASDFFFVCFSVICRVVVELVLNSAKKIDRQSVYERERE